MLVAVGSADNVSGGKASNEHRANILEYRMINFLEELPEDWQQALLSASPNQVLPPFAVGDGFQLCRLLTKHEPV